ncbi:MAG TPA: AtpZ/AtpI family protein [Desulfuromonadales bacterium]|nr:AtpZ/AtpI family protein [Desulfuromonadales bacterium]
MTEEKERPGSENPEDREDFRRKVEAKQQRKLRALHHRERKVWFGLGMFGLVGWSVALPALAFIALGIWLDAAFSQGYSWTLMLLVVGIAVGCLNAWFWVRKERDEIERERHNAEQRQSEKEKRHEP